MITPIIVVGGINDSLNKIRMTEIVLLVRKVIGNLVMIMIHDEKDN